MSDFKKSTFTCGGDGSSDPRYPGYREPEVTWNGWACPYFPWESVVRIVEDYMTVWEKDQDRDPESNACNDEFRLDMENKKVYFLTAPQDRTPNEDWEEMGFMKIDGIEEPVLPFMSWNWCWEDTSFFKK
jgi:hypothetical protein